MLFSLLVLNCFYLISLSDNKHLDNFSEDNGETCSPESYGINWILEQWNPNYGWGDQTHRAIITLFSAIADNKTTLIQEHENLMIFNLELQLAVALMRNDTDLSRDEISLYIHALIISGVNPHNFQGINLIEKLRNITRYTRNQYSPLNLLSLCNARARDAAHTQWIDYYIKNWRESSDIHNIENAAMAIIAYACAVSEGLENKMIYNVTQIAVHLASRQNGDDGSFGNLFTTALITHALKVLDYNEWNKHRAEEYLKNQKERSYMSIYFIEMALRKHAFIKDIAPKTAFGAASEDRVAHKRVKYSIKVGPDPFIFHTMTLKIPRITIFELMERAANKSSNFRFSYRMQDGNPFIYSIAGIPNNPEDGLFWQLNEESEYDRNSIKRNRYSSLRTGRIDQQYVHSGKNYVYLYWPF